MSAARQQQANLEVKCFPSLRQIAEQCNSQKPEVRAPLPDPRKLSKGLQAQLKRVAESSVDAVSRPESDWHISARILFPAPGKKDIGLTEQGEELKAVLRGCIQFIKLSLLFEDSYPAILSRPGFARAYLIAAAGRPEAVHIKARLETDLSFGALLADIVRDHPPHSPPS